MIAKVSVWELHGKKLGLLQARRWLRRPECLYNAFVDDLSHLANSVIDLEQLRARLARMSDAELIRFGRAGRYMCSPEAQPFGGKAPPRPEFVLQLREAEAEWRRRHPRKTQPEG